MAGRSTDPVDTLLGRLEGIRQTGAGRWLARCPAHGDRSPSLSVRVTNDGTVLVHCFAGCPAVAVVEAVGLTLADLFPYLAVGQHRAAGDARIPARDVLAAIGFELEVVAVALDAVLRGDTLPAVDLERLRLAHCRIAAAVRVARHG